MTINLENAHKLQPLTKEEKKKYGKKGYSAYYKLKKPLVKPQWKTLLKSKQKSIKEKEFWESISIPYESKPKTIMQLPFKHKHRPKGWMPFDSQGVI